MKSYCIKCNRERVIKIERTIIDKDMARSYYEEKVEGRCSKCGENLCHIFSHENIY